MEKKQVLQKIKKTRVTEKNNRFIWCDRYDYWSPVQACLSNCWRNEKCESLARMDEDEYVKEVDKYIERNSME